MLCQHSAVSEGETQVRTPHQSTHTITQTLTSCIEIIFTHTPTATKSGRLTVYLRDKNVSDAVEAAIIRQKSQVAKKKAKARLHANKMMDLEVAVQTELANTKSELDGKTASYENRRGALITYLQDQFKSHKLLRNGVYLTILIGSEYLAKKKPYTLRMNPFPTEGKAPSNEAQIAYLKGLLYIRRHKTSSRTDSSIGRCTVSTQFTSNFGSLPKSTVHAP